MDTAHQWPQGIVVKPIEEIVPNTFPKPAAAAAGLGNNNLAERKARPQKEQALNCPRCNSTNTKFCYYNNYSLTQPRYFCKTCRRYWTEGGSLRNIPVGGGSRKNKRSSSSSTSNINSSTITTTSSTSSASKRLPDLIQPQNQNPKINQAQDLNLTFPSTQHHHQDFRNIISDHFHQQHQLPNNNNNNNISNSSPSSTTTTTTTSHLSALELLTGLTSRGLNSFMPMPVPSDPNNNTNNNNNGVYSTSPAGFAMQDFKPTLNFSLDGLGSGYGSLQGVQENSGRLLFPFEDLKQVSSNGGGIEQNKEHGDSTGYWTGMLGGGSW